MSVIKSAVTVILLSILLNSCQAIGDIFSAGVWVGVVIVIIIIIILFAVFRKRD